MQKIIKLDVYNDKNEYVLQKAFYTYENKLYIINWLRNYYDKNTQQLAYLRMQGTDFSNSRGCFIATILSDNDFKKHLFTTITKNNLIPFSIYFSVRHAIPATWINDRDQFLYPNDKWQDDVEFQNDCLAFMLFHTQNRITSKGYANHFIPFGEKEVMAREAFESHFMYQFINGKIKADSTSTSLIEEQSFIPNKPLEFSKESKAVFDAGREVWRYYHQNFGEILEIHAQHNDEFYKTYNPNASLYDIKGYFQGFKSQNNKSKMNARSLDSHFNDLMANLRYELENLAQKIKPKIYEYEFLLE